MKLFKNEFVTNSLIKHNFNYLSKDKAIGKVLQIPGYGKLHINGFEHGFLLIEAGSGILEHIHDTNIELYNRISGDNSFQGGICLINESHKIELLSITTIVETFKVDKSIINYNDINILNSKLKEILLTKLYLLNNIIILLSNNISISEISKRYNISQEEITNIYNTYFIGSNKIIDINKVKEYKKL